MRIRRVIVALFAVIAAAACSPPQPQSGIVAPDAGRPNIVVVIVDDLRFDEFGAGGHPYLETPNIDRLAREGALFVNAFHAVPLCSPNRATLLTGQFPTRHGIIDNIARNLASHRLETFNIPLQRAGYRTAFLGKWHMGNDPTPRPGWDYWSALPGQGRSIDPELYEDGRLHTVRGYTTDLLTDRAVAFIEREHAKPFLVYLAHKAVHPDIAQRNDGSVDLASDQGYIPSPRDEGRYRGRQFPRRQLQSEVAADLEGKPVIRHALANLRPAPATRADDHQHPAPPWTGEETIRRRAEMIRGVDHSLGRIMAALDSLRLLDKTVIVFSSDNGFFFGEHGLTTERRLPYEESMRNPLLMRHPSTIPAGSRPGGLALTVDLAPTLLEFAGVPIGSQIQGRSLIPLVAGTPSGWRQSILVEFYTNEQPFPHLMDLDYRAVRTARYKYIHWIKFPEQDELYDLERDPFERRNVARVPAMAGVRTQMRDELARLVVESMGLNGQ
ncbi:MAG TPA: sulfatase-like hydrolase/transferase [Gemmatimonadaceae bacterium]|nr:sulfatase-like hydrolase/transferase [Gemmatimonadaceae bacterium]